MKEVKNEIMALLILSCNTGQGHNSCANAVKEYAETKGEKSEIIDTLDFVSHSVARFMSWGHTAMYRHFHWLFKLIYGVSERHPSVFSQKSGMYRMLALGSDKLYQYIKSEGFDVVICTHVFAALMMTEVQKRFNLPVALGEIATDYTCNVGAKESFTDVFFIPDESLAAEFESPSIRDEQLCSSGIPVRQMFYKNTEKMMAKCKFGVPIDHKHLLMMCGSMGCGPMKRLAWLLTRKMPDDVFMTIVCGTNSTLRKKLQRVYKDNSKVQILGYVKNMSLLMDSADLYLTKPGGISVTEAAVKNLPMVLIDAVGGCELYNKFFFVRNGGARTGAYSGELSRICLDLLQNDRKREAMQRSLAVLSKENAAQIIYDKMNEIRLCKSGEQVNLT